MQLISFLKMKHFKCKEQFSYKMETSKGLGLSKIQTDRFSFSCKKKLMIDTNAVARNQQSLYNITLLKNSFLYLFSYYPHAKSIEHTILSKEEKIAFCYKQLNNYESSIKEMIKMFFFNIRLIWTTC